MMQEIYNIENGDIRYKELFPLLFLICSLITMTVVFKYGFDIRSDDFFIAKAMEYSNFYNQDVYSKVFLTTGGPIILKIFKNIYDIPFFHFLFGIFMKFLIASAFFVLSWKITRDIFASTLSTLILFGLFNFKIINLNLPLGSAFIQTRDAVYFGYRSVTYFLTICTVILFIDRRYLFSGIVLAVTFYNHPLNAINVFLCLTLAYMIFLLLNKSKREPIYNIFIFIVPFLILILPYVFNVMSMFKDVVPISFSEFWSFILKNEPDDVSIVYFLRNTVFIRCFFLSVIASGLYVIFVSKKPISIDKLKNGLLKTIDLIIIFLCAPWLLIFIFTIYEGTGLFHYFPDQLNDILMLITIRRASIISAFFYIPVLSLLISRITIHFIRVSSKEIFGNCFLNKIREIYKVKKIPLSISSSISLVLTILFLVLSIIGSSHYSEFKKMIDFKHRPLEYYSYMTLSPQQPVYETVVTSGQKMIIPLGEFVDVCKWIRSHAPLDVAFIHPPYIRDFRAYSERQGFLSEKIDGNNAILNRKFATIYLKRFSDIHKGLTYNDLPGIVFSGGEPYMIMRQRYLSLNETDIEHLKKLYPGYRYFVTEIGHTLPYYMIYSNNYFIIYDLQNKESIK